MSMSDLEQAKKVAVELGIDSPEQKRPVAPMEAAYKMTDGYYREQMEAATKREADPDAPYLAEAMGMEAAQAAEPRELEIIEAEILVFKRQAGQSIIEIGKRLNEAKAQLSHGEWLPWLREKVDISERSAQDFMRLAREYSKSAEIADLGASKALALLALPVSERESFAAEKHDVDGVEKSVADMTTKELKKAIEERDAARQTMEAMKARAEVAEQSREKMEQDMRQLKELQRRARQAEEQKAEELRRAETELAELKARPVDVAVEYRTDPKELEAAREDGLSQARKSSQAILDAKEKALAAAEEKAKKLQEDLRKAREEARTANVNLQNAEKAAREAKKQAEESGKLARLSSNENLVKFGVLFNQAQDTVNRMADAMEHETPENQRKMRAALNALADAIRKAAGAA